VLRRRRRIRWLGWTLAAVGAASVGAAHVSRSHPTDDWAAFDHHTFTISSIVNANTVRLDRAGEVCLLGVSAPTGSEHGAAAATQYLSSHALGRPMTVLLETPQTRDRSGRLLAYLFDPDSQSLNVAMVRDGVAYAERRSSCALSGSIELAETTARKKKIGLWNGLRFDQMPLWRQWWLATLPRRGE
jgi:endonuclease YncB( thermonuclease family)